jgi:hypothetical protein
MVSIILFPRWNATLQLVKEIEPVRQVHAVVPLRCAVWIQADREALSRRRQRVRQKWAASHLQQDLLVRSNKWRSG